MMILNIHTVKKHQAWLFLGLFWLFLPLQAMANEAATSSAQVATPAVQSEAKGEIGSNPGMNGLTKTLEPSDYFSQIMLSLLLIVLIIFVSAWLLKRFGKVNGAVSGQMKVMGVMALGQREKVVLLELGNEQLLLGVTASRVSLLHKLEEPISIEDSATKKISSAFADRLQEAIGQNGAKKDDSK